MGRTLTPTELAELPEYSGIWFDRQSLMTYTKDENSGFGVETGWTFENATWRGPFGWGWWPWLNPMSFATAETAVKVKTLFSHVATSAGYRVDIDDYNNITGPFIRTVERFLLVSGAGEPERYSCGLLAANVIRRGALSAVKSWAYELVQAGFTNVKP